MATGPISGARTPGEARLGRNRRASGGFRSTLRSFFRSGLPVLLAGLCIGWMVGLSVAPTAKGAIEVLLAFVISVTALVVGIRPKFSVGKERTSPAAVSTARPWRGNPWPVALLAIGVATGSTVGLTARTNGWLWRGLATGVDREKLGLELGLKAGPADQDALKQLKRLPPDELLRELSVSHDPFLQLLFKHFSNDPQALASFIKELP